MDGAQPTAREPGSAARVLVLVGRGRYEDRWHDGAAVGHRVVRSVQELGHTASMRGTFPDSLDGVTAATVDLLVVTAGAGRVDPDFDGDDAAWTGFHQRLADRVTAGMPVLALHQAASTFADSRTWAAQMGGRWIDGISMHPPLGNATFRAVQPRVPSVQHPIVAGLSTVDAYDERYCFLDVDPRSEVLLATHHDGRDHPVAWIAPAPGRLVYDGLGHDVRSFDSPSRRDLLRREISWLLDLSELGAPLDPPLTTRSTP